MKTHYVFYYLFFQQLITTQKQGSVQLVECYQRGLVWWPLEKQCLLLVKEKQQIGASKHVFHWRECGIGLFSCFVVFRLSAWFLCWFSEKLK